MLLKFSTYGASPSAGGASPSTGAPSAGGASAGGAASGASDISAVLFARLFQREIEKVVETN